MIIPFGFLRKAASGATPIYNDVSVMYTLRRPSMTTLWTNAVLKIRRSSDNATAFVFFDGSAIDDTITLSSLISTASNTTPDATTLTTWVGANDAFVEQWIGITANNTIDANKTAIQATTASQPKIVTTGAINTKNGKPKFVFDGGNDFLKTTSAVSELASTNNFTVLSVSHHDVTAGRGIIFTTSDVDTSYYFLTNDRRTNKQHTVISNDPTVYQATLLAQQNSSNQKLLTTIHNATNIISYYNSTIQQTTAHSGLSYTNTTLKIGAWGLSNNVLLNGSAQEITIFPSDKTTDLTTLDADINTYYSIY